MSEILGIDLEPHRVSGVLAEVSNGGMRVLKTFSASVPEEVLRTPTETGMWLAQVLQQNGISAKQVCVCLPRDEVVVRHMELPPSTDEELPTMVRFQAATKSTVPIDQMALDYLPLPQRADFNGRDVLLTTVPQERIARLYGAAIVAGLEVISVGVSSIATAGLVLEAEVEDELFLGANDVSLVVARHGDRVELSLLGQGHLYFSHSTQMATTQGGPTILVEINRALVGLSKRIPDARISRAWLIGSASEDAALGTSIGERFGCEIKRLDPLLAHGVEMRTTSTETSHSAFAGPIGQLLGHSRDSKLAVDFLNPRRPVVKKDYSQHKRWAMLAAGGLLLVGIFGYRSLVVADIQAKVVDRTGDLKTAKELAKKLEPQVKIAAKIGEWTAGNVNWLDQTQALSEKMEGTERRYLTEVKYSTGTSKLVRGTMTVTGYAKSGSDVYELNESLSEPNTDVEKTFNQKGSKDGDYPQKFQSDINMKKPEAVKPTASGKK